MKKLASIEDKLIPGLFLAILIAIWQWVAAKGWIAAYILPSPKDIGVTFIQILPEIKEHIFITLQEAFVGFFLAIIFSVCLALCMDHIRLLKRALYPLLIISQTVPIIALAPLFVMWFGFGLLPKIIVVILVCFFPIIISLLDGLNAVDEQMLNLLKSMGASPLQIFRLVKLPAVMVHFFSGLRIAATYSIMGAVIGEWLGGNAGLGVYMLRVKHAYAMDKVFAAIFIIVILSILVFWSIALLQGILMPWYKELNKNK